jgi:hypothetical protein
MTVGLERIKERQWSHADFFKTNVSDGQMEGNGTENFTNAM